MWPAQPDSGAAACRGMPLGKTPSAPNPFVTLLMALVAPPAIACSRSCTTRKGVRRRRELSGWIRFFIAHRVNVLDLRTWQYFFTAPGGHSFARSNSVFRQTHPPTNELRRKNDFELQKILVCDGIPAKGNQWQQARCWGQASFRFVSNSCYGLVGSKTSSFGASK